MANRNATSRPGSYASPRSQWASVNNAFAALLVLFAVWAYFNSLAGPFVLDDIPMIAENPGLLHFWPPNSLGERRALAHISFAIDRRVWGLYPVGYHAMNLIIHAGAALLLFGLVRRTLELPEQRARFGRSATFLAFTIALLWEVHPLTTSAVTYVIQRLESLAMFFYLACLYGMVRGSRHPSFGRWNGFAIVAGWLAMFTKEVAITLPLVALVYDRIYLSRNWENICRLRWAMYACLTAPAIWVLYSLIPATTAGSESSLGFHVRGISAYSYLITQSEVIVHYLGLVFWPKTLCLDYAWPPVRGLSDVWLPCVLIGGMLLATILGLWKFPRLAFLGFAFFVVLAPTSSFVPLADLAFEHRMYLPLATVVAASVIAAHALFCLGFRPRTLVGLGLVRWKTIAEKRRVINACRMTARIAAIAAVHLVSQSLLIRTIQRNADFRSHVAMGEATVKAAPNNARAHVNLGGAYVLEKRFDEAAEHLRRSHALRPNAPALAYLGWIAHERGDHAQAKEYLRGALRLNPEFAHAHDILGQHYVITHDWKSARAEFELTIRMSPAYAPAYFHLAELSHKEGKVSESLAIVAQSLLLQPDLPGAMRLKAWLLATSAGSDEAGIAEAEKLARRLIAQLAHPEAADFDALAAALARSGHYQAAEDAARRARSLVPADQPNRAAEIDGRIELYQGKRPYFEQQTRE